MQVLMMEANNLKSHVPAPSKLSAREAMKLSRAKRKASLTAEQLKELNKEKSAKKRNQRENAKTKMSEEQLKQLNKEKSAKKRKQPKKCYAQAD